MGDRRARWRRVAAGLAVMALMGWLLVRLAPYYEQSREFERALEALVRRSAREGVPEKVLRVRVLDRAAALGLVAASEQVRVDRGPGGWRVEVRYGIPVDLVVYTVSLHFRARAQAGVQP